MENITVVDALKEIKEIENKLDIENTKYIGAMKHNKCACTYTEICSSNFLNIQESLYHGFYIEEDEVDCRDLNVHLKCNRLTVEYYITRLHKLKAGIEQFNSKECIIIKSKKIPINEALIQLSELEMQLKLYETCLSQHNEIVKNKSKLQAIIKNRSYSASLKVLNPNNINDSYAIKIKHINLKIKTLRSKMYKKWENSYIQIDCDNLP